MIASENTPIAHHSPCPCGSGHTYLHCCQPFIQGAQHPKTPEQLMRSRYTAYTQCNADYLFNTLRDNALKQFNRSSIERSAKHTEWTELHIIEASPTDNTSTQATVEFIARYKERHQKKQLHEKSLFKRYQNIWYYVDSLPTTPLPITQRTVKQHTGRNDPCPCGSGKKYKHCCL